MSSGIPSVGYFAASDNNPYNRYTEGLQVQGDYYKELQYWLAVYQRAQQFGLPNTTIADVSSQIFRVSQKLSLLRQLYIPAAQNELQSDVAENAKIQTLFNGGQQG